MAAPLPEVQTDGALRTSESTCGRSGYCVRGLTSLNCPECESDLRAVGIIPPGGRRRHMSPAKRMVFWTIGLAVAALLISCLMQVVFVLTVDDEVFLIHARPLTDSELAVAS